MPEFTDSKGVSLLLINSLKGNMLFEDVKDDFEYIQRPADECLCEQQRLQAPVAMPENRERFWQDYFSYGFTYLIKNYTQKMD